MKPFRYQAPSSVDAAVEAVEPMGVPGQGGAFLAGGTTLIDLMKLSVATPPSVTDIKNLSLDGIEEADGEVRVGARVTMAEAASHPIFLDRAPVLSDALWKAASPQLRNVATLGGNILQRTRCPYFRDNVSPCNKRDPGSGCAAIGGINRLLAVLGTSESCIATYAGDFANALILFDTTVETHRAAEGPRQIELEDLHVLPEDHPERETVLADDELITGYRFRLPDWARRSVYVKARDRESYAFALASAAVALDLDGETIREARIGLGGVATVPWRAREAEDFLKGKTVSEETGLQAGRIAFESAQGYEHNAFKIPLGRQVVAKAIFDAARKDVSGSAGQSEGAN
ncbi:xanthine dehydrogenase YagS FAD-binding subunit [Fulvimarina manganoxydans]|uniref:Xanthine dehydrogenase YagS FAD-binding subunit n=1 Tax=Fulvimarina manganoxydans TaxID=937218 RepID=A0A1W2EM49_9HYPH|nr:FAD binding domain-containing protein [Fulvimarina manganoxydans]SMD10705.1 xanthine dehydrogenase YagS FAD-binding subunit [Fulvimarina manganoxydans]